MGDVFEAFDRDRGEVVALKTLTRADADTFARFKREFRALQSMVHPNLVSIGELICAEDLWFFSMELVDGTHFQEHVRGDVHGLRAALRQLVVGVMLYEALTGTMPHHGHALQIMVAKQHVEPTPPHELKPEVPRDLSELCSELLAIEPGSRPTATGISRRLGIDLVAAARTSPPIVTPVFVGRERELAELAQSAEAARTQPRV